MENSLKRDNYEEIKEKQFTFGNISEKLFCLKISINRVFRYGYNGHQISNYIIVAGKRAPISKLQSATRCYTAGIIFLVGNGNKWHLTELVINQQGIHLTFDLPCLEYSRQDSVLYNASITL